METLETSVASLIKNYYLIQEADECVGDIYTADPNHMMVVNALILAALINGLDTDIIEALRKIFQVIYDTNFKLLDSMVQRLDNTPLTSQPYDHL